MTKIQLIGGTVLALVLGVASAWEPMIFRFVIVVFICWLVANSESLEKIGIKLLDITFAANFPNGMPNPKNTIQPDDNNSIDLVGFQPNTEE